MSEERHLPDGWTTAIPSEIIDVRDGTHDTPKYVEKEGIPLVTSKNLKGAKLILLKSPTYRKMTTLKSQKGLVLKRVIFFLQ